MVSKFFEATVGFGAGNSSPVEIRFGIPVGPRRCLGPMITDRQRPFKVGGAPSIVCGDLEV